MDSNQAFNTASIFSGLADILKKGEEFIKLAQTGEGLNMDEKTKEIFLKEMKAQGVDSKIEEQINKIKSFKEQFMATQNNNSNSAK